MARRVLGVVLAAAALATVQLLACSATNQTAASGAGAGSGAAGVGGSGTGVGGGSTAASGLGGLDAGGDGSTGVGAGCVGTSSTAMPVPLDVLVMLDQSGSMLLDAGNGLSRWDNAVKAISTFTTQKNVAGMGMGIQYFALPLPNVSGCVAFSCTTDADCMNGCTTCGPGGVCHSPYNGCADTCDPGEYAWAEVPIQTLPGAASPILTSLGMHAPGGNTPTLPALQGAIEYASKWATAHPTHITVVALATDGEPGECDTDLNHINAVAAAGLAGTPSIRTFVIGVGGALSALDGIAAAGGTGAAYHVDLNTMATAQLVQILNQLRGDALACTYQIPPPPPGKMVDFSLVNVTYLPGKGPPGTTIPKVLGMAACPSSGDGWYYDDEASPTEIILCPSTCTTVSQDATGEVDVVLGCKTITN